MLTKEQLEERKKYIGGSDCAKVLGLSRWGTPLSVWAEKTGQIEPEDISDKLQVILGNKLEQTVAELFSEQTGKKVQRKNETIFHKTYPFLAANIDRRVCGESAGLEVKTVSAWKAKEFDGDELPREHILQCVHYLAVTGWDRWYLCALIGNTDLKIKTIERDEKLISDLIKKEVSFWNDYVLTGKMPAIITKNDAEPLSKLFPVASEEEIILGDDADKIVENLEAAKQDYKNLEGQIEQAENLLKSMLGKASAGVTSSHRIEWKNRKTSRFDKASLEKVHPEMIPEFTKEGLCRVFKYGPLPSI